MANDQHCLELAVAASDSVSCRMHLCTKAFDNTYRPVEFDAQTLNWNQQNA